MRIELRQRSEDSRLMVWLSPLLAFGPGRQLLMADNLQIDQPGFDSDRPQGEAQPGRQQSAADRLPPRRCDPLAPTSVPTVGARRTRTMNHTA